VEVWDPWCQHCKSLAPIWKLISNSSEFSEKMLFADINCLEHKKLCEIFTGKETPRFFWVKTGSKEPKRFSGHHSVENLIKFIRKQLLPQFIPIVSLDNITKFVESEPNTAHFLFNISIHDYSHLSVASNVSKELQHLPINVYLYLDEKKHEPSLHVFSSHQFTEHFNGLWTHGPLSIFMKHRSLPFLSVFNQATKHYIDLEKIPLAVFVHPDSGFIQNFNNLALDIHKLILTSQTKCLYDKWICNYVNRKPGVNGYITILDRNNRKYWTIDANISRNTAIKWTLEVLNNSIKFGGPGPGWFGDFFGFWYEQRGAGGIGYYILYIPVVSMILVLVLSMTMVMGNISMKRQRRRHND